MKPFCIAPFFHSHIDVDGSNKLCCISKNELVEEKFQSDLNLPSDEFWHSDYMNDRRRKMLDNSPPPECELCIRSNRNDNYKDHFERLYKDHVLNEKSFVPVDIDIRVPVCNFKCRICGPHFSTAISSLYKQNRKLLEDEGVFVPTENRELRLRTLEAFEKFIDSGKLEKVYFAGGEPTAAPDHIKFLKKLKAKNPDVLIGYNTNLSMKNDFMIEWIDVLRDFNSVSIQCSLDGVGELGEYLREGLQFSQFSENIDNLKQISGKNISVSLDVTLTSIGLFDLISLSEYALLHEIPVVCKFMVGGPATFLRCEFLDMNLRRKIMTSYEQFFLCLPDEKQPYLNQVMQLLGKLTELPLMSAAEIHDASKKIKLFDELYPHRKSFDHYYRQFKNNLESKE